MAKAGILEMTIAHPRRNLLRYPILLLILALYILSSCNCIRTKCFPPDCGRRPQVMTCWEDVVIEYSEGDEEEETDEEEPEECIEETPSENEDLLSPFVPLETDYRVSVGDVLEVSIFGDDETIVQHVVVAPDGRIYYTFVEGVYALGKTLREVNEIMTSKLGELYNNPVVTMNLIESEAQSFKILGRVQRPGLYNLTSSVRLREAIALAGGWATESYKDKTTPLQQIANFRESFIVRKNKKLDVDFEKLINAADNSQNIYVKPGDYIYIAKYDIRQVFILGAVRNPTVMPWKIDLTLMNSLAYAGAWTIGNPYSPDIKKALLLRGNLEDPCVIYIDLSKIISGEAKDFYLEPGDIVFLPEKGFRFARELVRIAINTFIQAFGNAAGAYYGGQILFPVGPGIAPLTPDTINIGF